MRTFLLLVSALAAVLPWGVRRSGRELVGDLRRGEPAGIDVEPAGPRATRPALLDRAGRRTRMPRRSDRRAPRPDPALLLDLVAVALAAGAPVPTALTAVGSSWPGADGAALSLAARSLVLGAPWDVAWTGASGGARAVAEALHPAWSSGASPVPLLRTAADRMRSRRRAEIRAASGRLGVRLVVPLALCHLPAFVLVGLVPVVVSLGSGLLG